MEEDLDYFCRVLFNDDQWFINDLGCKTYKQMSRKLNLVNLSRETVFTLVRLEYVKGILQGRPFTNLLNKFYRCYI